MCVVDPGDEVIIPVPYWTSYPDMAALAGAVACICSVSRVAGVSAHARKIWKGSVPPESRCADAQFPSNPTGVTYTAEEMEAILEWARRHEIFVISDEVYDQLVYPPAGQASACHWWKRHPESVAVVNALSKSFAMTGWAHGIHAGPCGSYPAVYESPEPGDLQPLLHHPGRRRPRRWKGISVK